MIARVAELQKLEAKATNGPWEVDTTAGKLDGISWEIKTIKKDDIDIESLSDIILLASLRNAAPNMLDALALVRAGDAEILKGNAKYLESDCTREDDNGEPCDDCKANVAVLRWYQELARLMEAQP